MEVLSYTASYQDHSEHRFRADVMNSGRHRASVHVLIRNSSSIADLIGIMLLVKTHFCRLGLEGVIGDNLHFTVQPQLYHLFQHLLEADYLLEADCFDFGHPVANIYNGLGTVSVADRRSLRMAAFSEKELRADPSPDFWPMLLGHGFDRDMRVYTRYNSLRREFEFWQHLDEWLLPSLGSPKPPEPKPEPVTTDTIRELLGGGGDGSNLKPARFNAEGGFTFSEN